MVELLDFLYELGRDASLVRQFNENPLALMAAKGLSEDCQQALVNTDLAKLGVLAAVAPVNSIQSVITSFGD
ncbi:hypothetical protein [Gallaecimonas mangrovi]|uniref:hypothetical protein n=1 Tax=Gallaecimonas mangrovi TaxID=2291597 RepID=UPI000E20360A|nr:hypothetical protein [Gallaecimonas mangrovi]